MMARSGPLQSAPLLGLLELLALAALALLGPACTTAVNPATGRREVVLMSAEDERRIDEEASRQIEATLGLVRDPELVAYVSQVGQELAALSPRQDVEYRFQVVEMEEPNAFALPGGHIYVSRGLLVLANTEAELAHVLGHEIGHVAARHAAARDAHVKTLGLATVLGNVLSGGGRELHESESLGGDPIARYARTQEREADQIGQELASRGGVEAGGMARFLIALDNYTKLSQGFSMPQTYFATHPATRERLAEAAAQAQTQAWRAPVETSGGFASQDWSYERAREAYLDRLEGMAVGRPASEGVFVDGRFLHADLGFSLRFPHDWEPRNEAAQVWAASPKRDGVVLLQLQGAGSDPVAAAREYAKKEDLAVRQGTPVRIGGLPAFRASAVVPTRFGAIDAEITWIVHEGRVYRLIGGVAPGKLRKYEGVFRKFAQSFRPLVPGEAAKITEQRLRTVRARAGETLAELSLRSGNEWDPTFTGVVNGIFVHERLREGQRVKIAVSEPYQATPAPPPAPDADADADPRSTDAGGAEAPAGP